MLPRVVLLEPGMQHAVENHKIGDTRFSQSKPGANRVIVPYTMHDDGIKTLGIGTKPGHKRRRVAVLRHRSGRCVTETAIRSTAALSRHITSVA